MTLSATAAIQVGQVSGLTSRDLGATFGVETITLSAAQLPAHHHLLFVADTNDYGHLSGSNSPQRGMGVGSWLLPNVNFEYYFVGDNGPPTLGIKKIASTAKS